MKQYPGMILRRGDLSRCFKQGGCTLHIRNEAIKRTLASDNTLLIRPDHRDPANGMNLCHIKAKRHMSIQELPNFLGHKAYFRGIYAYFSLKFADILNYK